MNGILLVSQLESREHLQTFLQSPKIIAKLVFRLGRSVSRWFARVLYGSIVGVAIWAHASLGRRIGFFLRENPMRLPRLGSCPVVALTSL